MKKIILFLMVLTIAGCGTRLMYSPEELSKNSNAELIENAIKDAAAQVITIPVLNKQKKYVVISSEYPEKQDSPLCALIEDSLISSLTESGFPVLERDKDVLLRVTYQEDKERMQSAVYPPSKEKMEAKGINTGFPKHDLDYGKRIQVIPTQLTPGIGNNNILTADYLISYRVLEAGLKYVKVNERDEYGMRQVKREALVKLNVKLVDAKNSSVIWGGSLSGMIEDFIPAWQKDKLKDTGYKFYPFTLPMQ